MLADTLLAIERLVLFVHNATASVLQGVALGLLSNAALERVTVRRYQRDSAPYAATRHVFSGLYLWEESAITKYFPAGSRLLVAAAGAGREMIALAQLGFRVDGFDCCEPLIKAGKIHLANAGLNARLEYISASAVPEWTDRYDGVIVGFSGYMYVPGSQRRVEFLKALRQFLPQGAPLMISFRDSVPGRRRVWTARIGTAIRRIRRGDPVEEGDCIVSGFQHHFVEHEIAREVSAAGFKLAMYSGGTCYGHAVATVADN